MQYFCGRLHKISPLIVTCNVQIQQHFWVKGETLRVGGNERERGVANKICTYVCIVDRGLKEWRYRGGTG